jgi:hypothetical protein
LVLRTRRLQRRGVRRLGVIILVGVEHLVVGLELELVVERIGRGRLVGRGRRRWRGRRRLTPTAIRSVFVVGRGLIGQWDATLLVDAGHLIFEAVVDRALVIVERRVVFLELGVLRDREFVVIGRDARSREIVHLSSIGRPGLIRTVRSAVAGLAEAACSPSGAISG